MSVYSDQHGREPDNPREHDSKDRSYSEQDLNDIADSEHGSWDVRGETSFGGMGQGDLRKIERDYLDSRDGAKSFYDAMTGNVGAGYKSAWNGNISDVDLSQYMDSVGIGYDQRAPLLGGFDAMATGRGSFGDIMARGWDSIAGNIPGLGLLSNGIDIFQRMQNSGVVGGDMVGRMVGGLTGNPLLGMGARIGMNAYNGIPIERQLLPELTNNAGMIAGMMGLDPMMGAAAGQLGQAMQSGDLSFGGIAKGIF